MKRIASFSMVIFLMVNLLTSCTEDIITTGDDRDNIVQKWLVQENSTEFGAQNYDVVISKHADDDKVYLDNFFGAGAGKKVTATYNTSSRTIDIAQQAYDGNQIKGSGSVTSDYKTISFNFQVDEGNGWASITATFTPATISTANQPELLAKK